MKRNGKNIAIVCWRPYQIFNAVNLCLASSEFKYAEIDLYLMNVSCVTNVLDNLRKVGIFRDIYLYDDYSRRNYILDRLIKIVDICLPKVAISRRTIGKRSRVKYDIIAASGWEKYFVSMVAVNKNCKVVMFEDGMGSYLGDQRDIEMPPSYKLLNRVTTKGPMSVKVEKLYLNRKGIELGERSYEVVNSPELTEQTKTILDQIFEYKGNEIPKNKKIIYLSQPYEDYKSLENNPDEDIIPILETYKDDVIVRLHPSQKKVDIPLELDESNGMWELVCGECVDRDTVLISMFSTTMFTPKIIYNKEPILIFLFGIYLDERWAGNKNALNLVNKVRQNYSNTIYTPTTVKELRQILDEIACDRVK